jgi:hypothetical protein
MSAITPKRIAVSLAICAAGLLIRQELRSGRQAEPSTHETAAVAPAFPESEARVGTRSPASDKRDCERMWGDGLTEQTRALQKQGLCPAGFDCWTNRAGDTICGGDPTHEELKEMERAGRELDEQLKR